VTSEGYVVADEDRNTSVLWIFAAGDVRKKELSGVPQQGTARFVYSEKHLK
jgi:thioredoxin reductase